MIRRRYNSARSSGQLSEFHANIFDLGLTGFVDQPARKDAPFVTQDLATVSRVIRLERAAVADPAACTFDAQSGLRPCDQPCIKHGRG